MSERFEGHTPGPWWYEPYGQQVWHGEKPKCDGLVCDIRGWGELQYKDGGDKMQDATGVLIAAAPDLLKENAALKERLDKMRHVIELLKSGAEEALKINPHHDTLCYKQEEPMGSGECDCWRSYCHATIETANKYLADSLRKEATDE